MKAKSSPRLLVVTTSYPRFADDTVAPFLARSVAALEQLGAHVDVLAPAPAHPYPLRAHVHWVDYAPWSQLQTLCYGDGILTNIQKRPMRTLWIPSLVAALHRRLRSSHHDAVLAHWLLPNALCAIGADCAKVVGIAHGSDISLLERLASGPAIAQWLNERCHALVFVSAELKRRFERLCQQHCGTVLHPAIPQVLHLARRNSRQQLGLTSHARVVLYLGRLQHNKGVHLLIDAVPADTQLLIAGTGPELVHLRQRAQQQQPNVHFLGAVPPSQHAALFAAADLVCIPSFANQHGHAEGLPSVLLEAFAHGVPVVASKVGGIAELLEHQKHGLLVEAGDVDDLRTALQRMLQDRTLQQHCRRAITQLALQYRPARQAVQLLRLCTSPNN